jgi:hypothetical protein
MAYFEEIFYIICSFLFGYLLFKNDISKSLAKNGIINKDFSTSPVTPRPSRRGYEEQIFLQFEIL